MTTIGAALELLWSAHDRCPTGSAVVVRRTAERDASCRLWWARDQRRIERDEPRDVLVVKGRAWWQEGADAVVTVGDGQWFSPPAAADDALRDFVRDLGWLDVEVRGTVEHAGRSCLQVSTRPRQVPAWVRDRPWSSLPRPGVEQIAAVDDELGLVVRLESRLESNTIEVTELVDLEYGKALPTELFSGPPSGRQQQTVNEACASAEEAMSLDEAIRRAGFTVVVPSGLSSETFPVRVALRRDATGAETVSIVYRRPGGRHFAIHEGPSLDALMAGISGWNPQGGRPPSWLETTPVGAQPRVALLAERAETSAVLFGDDRNELADVARSLVPVGAADDAGAPG